MIAVCRLAVLLSGAEACNVWRAKTAPMARTLDPVESGRVDLHNHLP